VSKPRRRAAHIERSVGAGCGEVLDEGRRGLVSERGLRPRGVEIFLPFGDGAAAMIDVEEEAPIQELAPHSAIERSHIAVLHRLPRRDVVPLGTVVLRSGKDCVRGEIGAVVGNDHVRLAAAADQVGQLACQPSTGDRRVRDGGQALSGHVIDDVEHAEASSAERTFNGRRVPFRSERRLRPHGAHRAKFDERPLPAEADLQTFAAGDARRSEG